MGRGEPCINLSPIEFLLQYRFATPKPLKACPGLEGCRTAPLRNRVLVDSLPPPPLQFPPFPLKPSESPGSARSRPGRGARRSRSLDGEDRAATIPRSGKGGLQAALRRRSRLRSGLWILKSQKFCFHRASRPATCLNYYLSSICICGVLARTSEGECGVLARTSPGSMWGLSTRKTLSIHGQMWKTTPGPARWAL